MTFQPPTYACDYCCDTGCIVDATADESTFVTEADGLINCPLCSPTPAQALREYLANGGEPSPIGWYGVFTERRAQPRLDVECSTCGAKNEAPCDDDIHETTGQPRER